MEISRPSESSRLVTLLLHLFAKSKKQVYIAVICRKISKFAIIFQTNLKTYNQMRTIGF